jgi:acyl-coenzyme A thioesterase PaaI-like protein
MSQSLQDQYAAKSTCYGCGPTNEKGMKIKSFPAADGETVTARFRPQPHHQAFAGTVNGGVIATLLDCHSNWTATYALMKRAKTDAPPCTVTSEFHVKLLKPTPLDAELELSAKPVEVQDDRATIEATLSANGKVCATCRGTFVAVKPGHPAYHRW